jgi:hypothetical protein
VVLSGVYCDIKRCMGQIQTPLGHEALNIWILWLYKLLLLLLLLLLLSFTHKSGACGGTVGWGTALQAGRLRCRFPMVSEFLIDIILPAVLWLWSRLRLLTEMSTFLGSKGGRCLGLTTLPHSCADCHEIWESQPPGTPRSCPDLYRFCFTFTHKSVLLHLYVI